MADTPGKTPRRSGGLSDTSQADALLARIRGTSTPSSPAPGSSSPGLGASSSPTPRATPISSGSIVTTTTSTSTATGSGLATTVVTRTTTTRQSVGTFRPEKFGAVVLDIGAAYTKCGFAGEAVPRHIIPSVVRRGDKDVRVFDIEHPIDPETQRAVIADFLHNIFHKILPVKSHEKRVLICESVLCPHPFRRLLVDVLFKNIQAISVALMPSHALALYPLGLQTALVVDCGYSETSVMAVCDGVPVHRSLTDFPAAGRAVQEELEFRLISGAKTICGANTRPLRAVLGLQDAQLKEVMNVMEEEVLEDIKVRTCIAAKPPAPAPGAKPVEVAKVLFPFRAPGSQEEVKIEVDGSVRTAAYDILFNGFVEGRSVASAVLEALCKCSRDDRKELAENIVLIGGTCMAPGFAHRLQTELRALVATKEFQHLQGSTIKRIRLEVQLTAADDTQKVTEDKAALKGHIATKLGVTENDLDQFSVEVARDQPKKVLCTAYLDKALGTSTLQNATLSAKQNYTVDNAVVLMEEHATGIERSFGFHVTGFQANCLAWAGGAIFASLDVLLDRSLTSDQHAKGAELPDWTSPKSVETDKPAPAAAPARLRQIEQCVRPLEWGAGALSSPPAIKLVP
eukprot:m.153750 g.153750  ORF g.153750 m.153750 type:complete len:627 (-) comp16946_c1_seq2:423-2303(-)